MSDMNEQRDERRGATALEQQDGSQAGSQLSTADLAAAGRVENPPQQPRYGGAPGQSEADARATRLFGDEQTQTYRSHWLDIQAGFVDEPRMSVEQADGLVAEVIKSLAETFASERNNLEQQWDKGDNISTEDLRLALQRYRSFFDRLLSV